MSRAVRFLIACERGLVGALALAAALLVVSESVIRFFAPAFLPDWGAEVTVYLIAWAVMLSAARLVRDDLHVAVDIVVHKLSPRGRRALSLLACITGALVCAAVAYAGAEVVAFALRFGDRSDSSIRFPMWLYNLAIPVGFALSALQYAAGAARLLRPREE